MGPKKAASPDIPVVATPSEIWKNEPEEHDYPAARSFLPLLPKSDPSVTRDLAKVKKGDRLSPVLLVRGDMSKGVRAIIADGYHRVCASYHLSENEQIPCRLIDYPDTKRKK